MTTPALRLPHPLILLLACLAVAAAASWVVPAGRYERREDAAVGRTVVVPGTYQRVEPAPVGPFAAAVAVPKGLADAASVVFLVFLVGGAFAVVEQTGALTGAVAWLATRLGRRKTLVIPIASVAFALGGLAMNMQEEIIAFVPVLLVLAHRLGFDPLTAVAMSAGSAAVGAAFSPINPFQVGIAQQLAELPPLSGGVFRTVVLLLALGIWVAGTIRYGRKTLAGEDGRRREPESALASAPPGPPARRPALIIALVVLAFALLVYGLLRLGWGFDELSALFFVMGVAAGLIAGFGWSGTAEAFGSGFRAMAGAALLIGFARAIYLTLDQGRILDTLVHGLFTPLEDLPLAASAIGMMAAHTLIHIPVPSVSGQAVLTIPILVPLSDLLQLSRQVTVLAYQYGTGLCEILTPTNGALMAILAAAGVPFDRWLRFVLPLWAALFGLGAVAVVVGIAVGL
ncbi:MAG: YfcC family protein [Gemmatimonadales bacterium]